ncbi:MAG: DNA polymerase III subunit gamma/tau [Nitrospiraceae bacterium]
MDYQVSARKYRPAAFEDVIGQPHVVRTLVNAITTKRIAHAFLFSGTRGVGKTTVARLLAKALNCERGPTGTPCGTCPSCLEIAQGTSVDVIEIDGASNTGVDDVRELRENVKFTPFRGGYRVYIIDEVHMLSNSAFNALLKTLEEPPAHVVFIFATTEIHKIPPTILSRCQHYNFRRIPRSEITQRLRHVANQDGVAVDDGGLALMAKASEGSMRDALSLLDQAVAFSGKTIRATDLEALLGSVPQEHIRAMIASVLSQDSPRAVGVIAALLDQGHDLRTYCAELVESVRNLLVAAVVPASKGLQELRSLIELSDEELRQVTSDAKAFSVEQLQELFRIFSHAEDALRASAHPRFVLEVAAVRATQLVPPATSASSTAPAASSPRVEVQATPSERQSNGPAEAQAQARPQAGATGMAAPGVTPPPAHEPLRAEPDRSRQDEPRPAAESAPSTRPPHPQPDRAVAPSPATSSRPLHRPAEDSPGSDAARPPDVSAPTGALNWEQVLERVSASLPNVAPFLAMGMLVSVEGSQATLGYPKAASVAFTRMTNQENLRMVSDICTDLAGHPVRLRVIELPDGQSANPSLAALRAVREQNQQQALLERARANPLVKHTLELFGSEVAAVRQTPPEKEGPS